MTNQPFDIFISSLLSGLGLVDFNPSQEMSGEGGIRIEDVSVIAAAPHSDVSAADLCCTETIHVLVQTQQQAASGRLFTLGFIKFSVFHKMLCLSIFNMFSLVFFGIFVCSRDPECSVKWQLKGNLRIIGSD